MKQVDKNILDATTEVIAHCCNCFNTMGSGVARAIREEYPGVYEVDCLSQKGDRKKLGTTTLVGVSGHNPIIKFVANMYGQYTFGRDKRQVSYEAIYTCLESLKGDMIKLELKSVSFPHGMCCMRAGGDWRIVEKMIEIVFENSGITVEICKYME